MKYGILGSGSWGTALAKILTENGQEIGWYHRTQSAIDYIRERRHNQHYIPSAHFNPDKLHLTTQPVELISGCDYIVIAIPSAYVQSTLESLPRHIFDGKIVISAIKGILPGENILLNEYLAKQFGVNIQNYFAVLGPCHAEEVAAEKLSYLTFSGVDEAQAHTIADSFKTHYLNTIVNTDIFGVQYAAVLKNIYACGAGIAHGLDYGDNFLSVLIANSADEMAGFLRKLGVQNIQVGTIDHHPSNTASQKATTNYAASVYLGDLLVTCYSLHSRNRSFGNMIGKGYSVKAAQLEMNMVAEGYNASKCMYAINERIGADMPIAQTIYEVLWKALPARDGFQVIEKLLV